MTEGSADAIRIAHVTTADLTLRFILLDQLRGLRDQGFDVTAISAPGPWVSEIEANGIRHIPWAQATRAWDLSSDLRAFVELLGIFRRERFDLVHTHNPKPGVIGRIAARLAQVPCVVNTVHGFYATAEDRLRKRLAVLTLERLAARFSDLELYQSGEDLEWALSAGVVRPSKSVLLADGGTLSQFDPEAVTADRLRALRSELGIPAGALTVATIGRLVAEKGFREFIAASRAVRATLPHATFLAIGDRDADKPDALTDAEIEAARHHVIFTGPREDIRDLLALTDVFVLASWREGLPRAAIEAAAMGVPLVLTDIRGCREIVRDPTEGVLVPPRDSARLATAIAELLQDPERRARMSSVLRAGTMQRFDEQRVAATLTRSYQSLFAKKGLWLPGHEQSPRVRRARRGDAAAIARIHAQALPDAFLPRLGLRFLERLYRAFAADPEATLLVAENGRPVGFAVGVVSVRRFYKRFLLSHGVSAAIAAAPNLVRPGVIRGMLETARYPATAQRLPAAELLSIALVPRFRRSGLGRSLADGVVSGLAERGAREVKVVVGAQNEVGNRFYEALGFRLVGSIGVHNRSASHVWVK